MRTHLSPLALLAVLLLAGCGKPAPRPASVLTEKDRAFLASYEKIRAALAKDDMRTVKRAAGELAEAVKPGAPADKPSDAYAPARAIADSPALDRARDSFKALSVAAIRRAGDVAGYYVMVCPMTPGGEWLQPTPDVDNPYMGRYMHDCGGVKK